LTDLRHGNTLAARISVHNIEATVHIRGLMRFIETVRYTDDLIDAVAAGEVVFVCGAGYQSGPVFRSLGSLLSKSTEHS